MNSNNKKIIRNLLIYLGIPILLVVLLLLLFDRGADQTGLKYSDVLSYFEDGKVSAYSLNLGTGEMKLTVTEDSSKKESVVRYTVPNVNLFYNDVSDYIKSYNEEHPNNRMTQDVIRPAETSWLVSLIPTLLMIALLVAFWVFMMKRMGGGGAGNQMNFGKAKVKQTSPTGGFCSGLYPHCHKRAVHREMDCSFSLVIWFSIAPAFLCFFDYSITTSGLIRSFGLSFISISAGSTLSRPVNLCVISFSG